MWVGGPRTIIVYSRIGYHPPPLSPTVIKPKTVTKTLNPYPKPENCNQTGNKIKTKTKIKTQTYAEYHIVQSRIGQVMIRENLGRDVVVNFPGDKLGPDQNCLGGVTG